MEHLVFTFVGMVLGVSLACLVTLCGKKSKNAQIVTLLDTDLRQMIGQYASDNFAQEKQAMLRSILDLADVEVGEIMVHRRDVLMIDADLPEKEIIALALDSPYTRVPLFRQSIDNIVGILHSKLLLKELSSCGGDESQIEIGNTLIKPWFVPETTSLFDQLQEFRRRREHFAIVVDEYGLFKGILTLEDILEEIVGDIEDEYDAVLNGVRPQADGTYLVEGKTTIRDLNREFGWGLPDDSYATVAGLVLFESQKVPRVGQKFSFYGFRFDIVRRQRNQITLVRVTPPAESEL